MLEGSPFAHEVDFSTGLPTGAVVYSVLGNDNKPIAGYEGRTVTPTAGAMSITLLVPSSVNICNKPLFEVRTLTWTYVTASGVVTGRTRYRIEKLIPFPVTEEGVRAKLGVEEHEVEDNAIDLLMAYASLTDQFDLSPYENQGSYSSLIVLNAIEAQAALDVLPSLQLAVAKSEDSGTNKYQRFTTVDWSGLADSLSQSVSRLRILAGVADDVSVAPIFLTIGKTTDALTGNDYAS